MPPLRRPAVTTLIVVAFGLLTASAASAAGTYSVFSCTEPTGALDGALGWTTSPAPSGSGVATNTCTTNPGGGALNAALAAPTPSGDSSATWSFAAPANTRIVRLAANRATTGVTQGTQASDVAYTLATDAGTLEQCLVSDTSSCVGDLSGGIDKQGLNAGIVSFRVLCTNAGASCTRAISTSFNAITVGLSDPAPPAVSGLDVLDDGDSSGTTNLTFNASDVGGGVYRALIKVDGKLFRTQLLAQAPCADVDALDADAYEFNQPVPCPLAVTGADVKLSVKDLPSGPHAVEIDVEDAAGNATPVYGPISFPKLNVETGQGAIAGEAARLIKGHLKVWFVKGHKTSYTSRFGVRVVTRGRLTDSKGHGIQGARIDVYHILASGKRKLLKTGLKTRAHGDITLILPINVDTRHVEYDYRALRPGPVTSHQTLGLTVMRHGRKYVRKGN